MALTYNLATWFLFATHHLIMMIICAKLFANPIMYGKLWPGHDSGTHTHTHTQRVNSKCPSAISWRGIKRPR